MSADDKVADVIEALVRTATASAPTKVRRVPQRATARPASGVVTSEGRNTKYTRPSAIGVSAIGGRASTKFT